jgi:pyruvate/2-oxoglutarate dehydrogenase complex dihydrolipoamide dehydrogenase (E3) component
METLTANEPAAVSEKLPAVPARNASEYFDLVVLGADPLAETAAVEAARLGARVAWFAGTTQHETTRRPLQAWLAAARAAHAARTASDFGVQTCEIRVDFREVAARTARVLTDLERFDPLDSLRALGISVFREPARLIDANTFACGERTFNFRRALIATGERPAAPSLSGLADVGYVNRITALQLTELPARWIVLGSGVTACEFAQTFRRFGCEVHLVAESESLLPREEPHASELVRRQLEREGIVLHLGWSPVVAEKLGGAKAITLERQGERLKLFADEILAAVGELPHVTGLGLDAAGVEYDERGIAVDEHLRTSNHHVFALGDVCARGAIHAAAHARVAIRNALLWGRFRASRWHVPRVIDTDPVVARIGLTRAAAAEQDVAVESFRLELAEIERAVLDGDTNGFAIIHVERGGDRIQGATIVGRHANALIGEVSLAMNRRLGLGALTKSLHGELSPADLLCELAERARPKRLTPQLAGWLKKWFTWRRGETNPLAHREN